MVNRGGSLSPTPLLELFYSKGGLVCLVTIDLLGIFDIYLETRQDGEFCSINLIILQVCQSEQISRSVLTSLLTTCFPTATYSSVMTAKPAGVIANSGLMHY